MTDKHLTESAWKTFAKGSDYKDAALLKALAALSKAERDGPQAVLDALDELEKQLKTLRSAHKGDKDLTGYLDKVDKAAEAQRKDSQKELKEAEAADDEEEDSPALLTSKLVPLIKQVRKGDVVMKAMIVTTGKDTAVMLSKRAIAPTRSKLLKEYLGASGGVKTILGDCLLEENAITFVVQSQAAGLAKKLKLALHKQTELRLKIRVRGEDPDDIDEEAEEGEAGDAAQPQAGAGADAPPDELQAKFDARLAKLEPLIAATLRAQRGDVARIRAVADFAREKGGGGNPAAGLKALDAVEQLLRAAVDSASAKPKADEKAEGDNPVDPATAFQARLAALLPRVKDFIATAGASGQDVKLKVSESGVFGRKREFGRAHALLDEAEGLMEAVALPSTTEDDAPPSSAQALYHQLLEQLQDDYLALKEAPSVPQLTDSIKTITDSWILAEELAEQGNFERASTVLKRLADANALGKLLAAKKTALSEADEGTTADVPRQGGSLVERGIFMLERWKRIPVELSDALQAIAKGIRDNNGDDDPEGIVAGIEDYLMDLLSRTQKELDDAINKGDASGVKGLKARIESDRMMKLLVGHAAFDGTPFRKAVLDAIQEIEDAMTA